MPQKYIRNLANLSVKNGRLITALILALACLYGCGDRNSETEIPPVTITPPIIIPPMVNPPSEDDVCKNQTTEVNWQALMNKDCEDLADYSLFIDPSIPTASPRTPGFLYQLSTELFSNYASKYRFLFIPQGLSFNYQANARMTPPVGSVLVKTFALPYDTSLTGRENEVLIETRLLIHRETGWTALTYQWKNQQAKLIITGADVSHTMNNQGETLQFKYHIPSRAECKICHQMIDVQTSKIMPIGLKTHVLNHQIMLANGQSINQLQYWSNKGWLNELTSLDDAPQSFELGDDSKDLTARAKGYLDINCAHCHNSQGFASISGLRLGVEIDHTSSQYGICKQPPGWDGGPDGLAYDIVPGNGERSIVHNRQILSSAKDRMPPIGREVIHTEGAELIKRWIDSLPPSLGNCQ